MGTSLHHTLHHVKHDSHQCESSDMCCTDLFSALVRLPVHSLTSRGHSHGHSHSFCSILKDRVKYSVRYSVVGIMAPLMTGLHSQTWIFNTLKYQLILVNLYIKYTN